MDEVTVTGTREEQKRSQTPATIGVIRLKDIQETKPGHPSEILERIPGVHINVTGGEGHMTAIRQPISTKPLYLYLEDGVPTRSTGFFNHNALYELNVPQAASIEVFKGPATALYGSDAIGGVINVTTRAAPLKPEAQGSIEFGQHGWWRGLFSGGSSWGDNGLRFDINHTHTDGWRDATDYNRTSASTRWDRSLKSGASLKTVVSLSDIDQQTAGSSALSRDDYLNNPTQNYTPISFRKITAFRLSTEYARERGDSLFTVIPYIRDNTMEMLPNWSLSYDPVVYESEHKSVGVLLKYRKDYPQKRLRLIFGADIDHSPGSRFEQEIAPVQSGDIYTSYSLTGTTHYDYDVTFQALSPYVHLEWSPRARLRLQMGLRYDAMRYDYDNNLSVVTTGFHRRPADTSVSFSHLSPKLGLNYTFRPNLNGFIAYRHAFRAPSESQLFRQGRAINTVDLKPVKADSFEVGLRGHRGKKLRYEVSLYSMTKKDDILTYRYPDGTRETVNAGETEHRGIEIGVGWQLASRLLLNVSYSYAKHRYIDWSPSAGVDYSGNEMSSAPRHIGNVRLAWRPQALKGGKLEIEWVSLGRYWMDDANTTQYPGHDILNLRINYRPSRRVEWFARLMNVTDKRFATRASYSIFRGEEYAPGMPRTLYAGLQYKFR